MRKEMRISPIRIEKEYFPAIKSNNSCQIKFGVSNRLQVEFLICRECFWCASCLNMSKFVSFPLFNKCPMCESVKSFDNIPICSNEAALPSRLRSCPLDRGRTVAEGASGAPLLVLGRNTGTENRSRFGPLRHKSAAHPLSRPQVFGLPDS